MKKSFHYLICAVIGGAYGALGVFLAGLFLKNMGAVASLGIKLIKLEGDIAYQVTDVLSQLKEARLASPYLAFILIFACLGVLLFHLFKKARHVVVHVGAWLFLLIPTLLAAAIFTVVNDILFLDIIKVLISIILNL